MHGTIISEKGTKKVGETINSEPFSIFFPKGCQFEVFHLFSVKLRCMCVTVPYVARDRFLSSNFPLIFAPPPPPIPNRSPPAAAEMSDWKTGRKGKEDDDYDTFCPAKKKDPTVAFPFFMSFFPPSSVRGKCNSSPKRDPAAIG